MQINMFSYSQRIKFLHQTICRWQNCLIIGQSFQLKHPSPIARHLVKWNDWNLYGYASAWDSLVGKSRAIVTQECDSGLRSDNRCTQFQNRSRWPFEQDRIDYIATGPHLGCVPGNKQTVGNINWMKK